MGHLLHEPLASGCHLSPVLSSGAEPITVPTLCTHARNTEHCVVFVQHLWSLADLHPTRCKQRAQAQKDVSTIYKRINAIHHLSAPSHFCARCVPPTEMPRVDDNGVPRAIPKGPQNYERQTRTRNHTTLLALSMHGAGQHVFS